jgi:hypothetical protein
VREDGDPAATRLTSSMQRTGWASNMSLCTSLRSNEPEYNSGACPRTTVTSLQVFAATEPPVM